MGVLGHFDHRFGHTFGHRKNSGCPDGRFGLFNESFERRSQPIYTRLIIFVKQMDVMFFRNFYGRVTEQFTYSVYIGMTLLNEK